LVKAEKKFNLTRKLNQNRKQNVLFQGFGKTNKHIYNNLKERNKK